MQIGRALKSTVVARTQTCTQSPFGARVCNLLRKMPIGCEIHAGSHMMEGGVTAWDWLKRQPPIIYGRRDDWKFNMTIYIVTAFRGLNVQSWVLSNIALYLGMVFTCPCEKS